MPFLEDLTKGEYKFDDFTKSAGEIGSKGFQMAEVYCKQIRPSLESGVSEIPKYVIKKIVELFRVDADWLISNINLAITKLNYYCDNYHEKMCPFIVEPAFIQSVGSLPLEEGSACGGDGSKLIGAGIVGFILLSLGVLLKAWKNESISMKGISFGIICMLCIVSLLLGVGCQLLDSKDSGTGKVIFTAALLAGGFTMWEIGKQNDHKRAASKSRNEHKQLMEFMGAVKSMGKGA